MRRTRAQGEDSILHEFILICVFTTCFLYSVQQELLKDNLSFQPHFLMFLSVNDQLGPKSLQSEQKHEPRQPLM